MKFYNIVFCSLVGLFLFPTIGVFDKAYSQQLTFERAELIRAEQSGEDPFPKGNTGKSAVGVSKPSAVTSDLDSLTATQLAESLAGAGVTVSNATFTGANNAAGSFSDGLSNGIGIESGVILSSGDISYVNGPNDETGMSANNGQPGDSNLNALVSGSTYDASVLEFDIVPTASTLSFQYVFASEEYNEWVGSEYNDVFGFFVDNVNIALIPSTTTPVAINNVNLGSNSGYYNNNASGTYNTQYDGFTTVLTAQVTVTPNVTHHIKLAIADRGDYIYDSSVFISGSSIVSGDLPSATTNNATDVTCDSAILHGTVNPNGLETTVWFQYRMGSGSYTNTTTQNVGDGSSNIAVSTSIGGLLPGEDYSYRLVAQNSEGTQYGSEIHFDTCGETAITLASFTARTNDDGCVTLGWKTASEVDNAGFNIYRSRLKDGNYKKINDELIAANGSEIEGASYTYEDTPSANGTYYYKLEDVDYDGVSTMHGPVKARVRK